jgi:hypothetical protein
MWLDPHNDFYAAGLLFLSVSAVTASTLVLMLMGFLRLKPHRLFREQAAAAAAAGAGASINDDEERPRGRAYTYDCDDDGTPLLN